MYSSPLFIIVAESTLIFAPIDQLGCATASAGVAASSCACDHVRNGPPLAVSVIFATSSIRFPARHWKIALCSESVGKSVAPCRATASISTSPAETSASLLASAIVPPRSTAAITGARPAQPTIAATVMSTGRAAASASACLPPAAAIPLLPSAARSSGRQPSSPTTASFAPNSIASAASSLALQLAVSVSIRHSSGLRRTRSSVDAPIDPVAPSRVRLRLIRRACPTPAAPARSRTA